jgi:hypothetical protein
MIANLSGRRSKTYESIGRRSVLLVNIANIRATWLQKIDTSLSTAI